MWPEKQHFRYFSELSSPLLIALGGRAASETLCWRQKLVTNMYSCVSKEHLFEPLHFWVFWFGNMLEFPCTPVLDILLLAAHIGRLRLIPLFLVEPLHHIIRKSAWEVNILGAEFLCIWPVFILPESVWIFVSCALICVFSAIVLNTEPPPHFF